MYSFALHIVLYLYMYLEEQLILLLYNVDCNTKLTFCQWCRTIILVHTNYKITTLMSKKLTTYLTQFLEHLEIERNRSQKTIQNYDFYLKRFLLKVF